MKKNKAGLLLLLAGAPILGQAADYTNFVVINLDDVGYGDFSFNGAYGYKTPNIDRMASEGMQFTHFLAAQPISGASRAGLLTGCYPNRIGFSGAPLPERKIDGVSLLPLMKQEEGTNPRESFVYYFNKNDLEAVTDGMFKLVFPHKYTTYGRHLPGNDGQPGLLTTLSVDKPELYDLRRDPGERYDVIAEYPDIVVKLNGIAESMRNELGDDLTRRKGSGQREHERVSK